MTAQHHPNHHPCCNTLLRYAAGTLSPAMHMFVDTHLTFCPTCRQELQTYESQAGLGLENLPPEELDVSCLNNLLAKIDENGPLACIDVTIPVENPDSYHYPEPLVAAAGVMGERIRWESAQGYRWWAVPEHYASNVVIFAISDKKPLLDIHIAKQAILLVLQGDIEKGSQHYYPGDVIKHKDIGGAASGETLCLAIIPAQSDKPSLWQRMMSLLCGDRH